MGAQTIGWLAGSGDAFLRPILLHLGKTYKIKPVANWPDPEVDLLWCDWCDHALIEVTSKPRTCPIVARLHSYEAFRESGSLPAKVDWSKVDVLVFVAEHVRQLVLSRYRVAGPAVHVVPNGVDLDRFVPDPARVRSKRVAWVGGVSFKKGPELFVQAAAALHGADAGYEFHVAGEIQQERFGAYLEHVLPRLGLDTVVHPHGQIPAERMPGFYRSMDYVLSTSPWEGGPLSVAEGIASGCAPLIHDWPGADQVYPFLAGRLWLTTEQLVEMASDARWRPSDRDGLYPLPQQLSQIDKIIEPLLGPSLEVGQSWEPLWQPCEAPVVSAAMIVRNESENLERCLRSIRGIVDEAVVLDTGSEDRTVEIAKALGARVFEEPWRGDFSLHRNHSLERCRGRWLLVIDGDEVLEDPADLDETLLERAESNGADGVIVRVDTWSDAGLSEQLLSPRVLRSGRRRYRYPVHNQLVGMERAERSRAIIRSSYEGTTAAKAARSIPLLENLAKEHPEEAHAPFHLAMTYHVIGELDKAREWGRVAVELAGDDPKYAAAWILIFLSELVLEGRDCAQAVLSEAIRRHPGMCDLHHGQILLSSLRWLDAGREPGPWAFTPQRSLKYLRQFREIARLLGLPLQITAD